MTLLALRGLESLEYQMRKDLETARLRRDAHLRSSTIKGRIAGALQRFFAVYCVTRILSVSQMATSQVMADPRIKCLYNVASQRSSSGVNYSDVLASILAYGFSRSEDAAAVSRQISLVLVGVIILSSIRMVLRGVTKVDSSILSCKEAHVCYSCCVSRAKAWELH